MLYFCTILDGIESTNLCWARKMNVVSWPWNGCKAKPICDMIKRNESDVGDVVFEILAKTVFKFLCFILFLPALSNPS